jgi:hypothetical protein
VSDFFDFKWSLSFVCLISTPMFGSFFYLFICFGTDDPFAEAQPDPAGNYVSFAHFNKRVGVMEVQ